MAQIAFLGLGNMGYGMAARLIKAGHDVRIYNRTQSKAAPLAKLGAALARTPREAANSADAVIAMVGDDRASRAVWLGQEGALAAESSPRRVMIECSTLSHGWVMELSKFAGQKGLRYLDCPVTGLPYAAARGELTLFLGGDRQTILDAQPFLSPISSKQIRFGEVGSGTAYKLIVNLMGSIQIAATAEGMLAAEKAGLDLNKVAQALGSGAAGSPNVVRICKLILAGDHETEVVFNAKWRLKDTKYGVEFAKQMGLSGALGILAEEMFQRLVDEGHGESAESKLIDILRP